jgi:hypothetical protein
MNMKKLLMIAVVAGMCGTALAWQLPATRRALMMDGMMAPAAGGGTLGQGLLAHWKLNDNAATTNIIESRGTYATYGFRNTSETYTNAGRINGAMVFNGSIDKGKTAWTGPSLPFSVSFWLNYTVEATAPAFIGWGYPSAGGMFAVQDYGDGKLLLYDGVYPAHFNQTSYTINNGSWRHVVVTMNTATQVSSWVDSTNWLNNAAFTTPSPSSYVGFGYRPAYGDSPLTGSLDDIRIYDRVLTTNEITQLYNGGAGTEDE